MRDPSWEFLWLLGINIRVFFIIWRITIINNNINEYKKILASNSFLCILRKFSILRGTFRSVIHSFSSHALSPYNPTVETNIAKNHCSAWVSRYNQLVEPSKIISLIVAHIVRYQICIIRYHDDALRTKEMTMKRDE